MGSGAPDTRRVLVWVTDAPDSLEAAAVAARLVSTKGEIVFLHVCEVPLEFSLDVEPLPEEEAAEARARELLGRCQAIADRYGVQSRRTLDRCHAAGPAVVEAAERYRATLLVLAGDDRFTRAGRLRLGATVAYVLRHARCRVLLLSTRGGAPARVVAGAA